MCFEVNDLLGARDELKAKGLRVLGDGEPRIGAHDMPVLFLLSAWWLSSHHALPAGPELGAVGMPR